MKPIKSLNTKFSIYQIEKVNDELVILGELDYIELVNMKEFTIVS